MFFKNKKIQDLPPPSPRLRRTGAVVQLGCRLVRVAAAKAGKKGFTLMEMLVALSIFVIVVVASLSIYAATLKASQKTTALTRIQQESQLIMSVLAKKVRTSRVNYSYYGTVSNPETDLAIIDLLDDNYIFSLDTENQTLTVSVNGGPAKNIPTTQVNLTDLKFYINPTTNPFVSLDEPPSSQPYVTIVMTVSSTKGAQTASLVVQQTIPQRSGVTQ